MVTPEQAKANVKTATAALARTLGLYRNDGGGFDIGSLSPTDKITLTNALAAYIRDNRRLFDTGDSSLNNPWHSAAYATNALPIAATPLTDQISEFFGEAASNARAMNPLDPQNVGTAGKRLAVAAGIALAVFLIFRFPRRA